MAGIVRRLETDLGAEAELFAGERIEVAETGGPVRFYFVDREPLLFERGGVLFPTLRGAMARPFRARRITVDMGAVPYVVNGADIMRPGIVAISDDVPEHRSRLMSSARAHRVCSTTSTTTSRSNSHRSAPMPAGSRDDY